MDKNFRFLTEVEIEDLVEKISLDSKIFMIGSCFADEIGAKLLRSGFNVLVNPFGTLYNVCSIYNSIKRLCECQSYREIVSHSPFFTNDEIIERDGGLYVTFSHHSRCGSPNRESFLEKINNDLIINSNKLKEADYVIITLGSSFAYINNTSSQLSAEIIHKMQNDNPTLYSSYVVSNCHKLHPNNFIRDYIHTSTASVILQEIVAMLAEKKIIFTVSPIRHLADGAHLNQISKSTLLLAIQRVIYGTNYSTDQNKHLYYFPSYEIMMDELRDYRWYSDDLNHPNTQAINYIFEKFKNHCICPSDYNAMNINEKNLKKLFHRPINKSDKQ